MVANERATWAEIPRASLRFRTREPLTLVLKNWRNPKHLPNPEMGFGAHQSFDQ